MSPIGIFIRLKDVPEMNLPNWKATMNILVITPAGPVAQRIVRELIAPEFSVRLITGNADELPEDIRSAVEIISGPVETEAEWKTTLSGVDSILLCHPSVGAEPAGISPEQLVEAIQNSGNPAKPRIVTVSGAGDENWEASFAGAMVRHIRCDLLMESFCWQRESVIRGVVAGPVSPETLLAFVLAAEVADVALRWLVRRNWNGVAAEQVVGSIALSHAQIAELFEEILNRPVRFRQLSPAAFIQWLWRCGMTPHSARETAAAFASERNRASAKTSQVASRMAFRIWAEREFAFTSATEIGSCTEAHCCCTI